NREQAFQSGGELPFGHGAIGGSSGLHGHGAIFRNVLEGGFFVGSIALDGFHEIGNQVVTALELHVNIGPGGVGAHPQLHQTVVEADQQPDHYNDDDQENNCCHSFSAEKLQIEGKLS